jgi:hypothetical protein
MSGLVLSNDLLMRRLIEESPFVIKLSRRFLASVDFERWSTTPVLHTATEAPTGGPILEAMTRPDEYITPWN